MKKLSLSRVLSIGLGLSSALLSSQVLALTPTNSAADSQSISTELRTQQALTPLKTTSLTAITKPIFYGTDGAYPFSSAVRVGNTLYMSGQMGFKDGKLVDGGIQAQTRQTLNNINSTLLKYGYQKSDLVKCMVMLTDMDDFSDFNEIYESELVKPYPVRSAFAVSELALGGLVEIECMATK